jgi:hypothetical protein
MLLAEDRDGRPESVNVPICPFQLFAVVLALLATSTPCPTLDRAPYFCVRGQAYHVLSGTHNNESGSFSLCECLDGNVYVGTEKDVVNAFLVEFDPHRDSSGLVYGLESVQAATGMRVVLQWPGGITQG